MYNATEHAKTASLSSTSGSRKIAFFSLNFSNTTGASEGILELNLFRNPFAKPVRLFAASEAQ